MKSLYSLVIEEFPMFCTASLQSNGKQFNLRETTLHGVLQKVAYTIEQNEHDAKHPHGVTE